MIVAVALLTLSGPSTGAARQNESRSAADAATQPNILLLAIDDFTRPYMPLLFKGFTEALSHGAPAPAVYFESLDAVRFEDRDYLRHLREWLARKYNGRSIDLIIALGEDALAFLADSRGEPWPAARVLYFESASVRVDTRTSLPQAGGMLLEDHAPAALTVVRRILPDVRNIALVQGASAIEAVRWRGYAGKVRQANLEPIELVVDSVEETVEAVAHLPPSTAVLVLSPTVDAHGNVHSPAQLCERLAAASTVPILSFEATHLGCGTVGGLMRDWLAIGRLIGDEARTRLENPSTRVVSIPVHEFAALAFDERQLTRLRIPEHRLPAGAAVQFRQPSLWREHRGLVLAALAVTLLQSLFIAGLVFERRRRRRAEITSRRHLSAMAHMDRRAAMGELATSLAHELNQPLNAILQNAGVAQMLLDAGPAPAGLAEMADIIGDIRKDDIRASEIIHSMRELLQKHELQTHPVDLDDVVRSTISIVRSDARMRGVELDMDLAATLPAVAGDRVHLQQVLLNLLMNALDIVMTMPEGRRHIQVSTRQSGGDVRLEVVDSGRGIPPEHLSEIFEPFFTTKREGSGMGMGLAIARSIVDAHGGRIGAENNQGIGATVWFTLPATPEPPSRTGAGPDTVTKVL